MNQTVENTMTHEELLVQYQFQVTELIEKQKYILELERAVAGYQAAIEDHRNEITRLTNLTIKSM